MSDSDETIPPASKLTRSKEAWARDHKFITGRPERPEAERLPPGALPAGWERTSRNAMCPCGSGKKFKHCHGTLV